MSRSLARSVGAALLGILTSVTAMAQNPDTPEPGSVEAIAAATTDPSFSNPLVNYVPDSKTVPSPTRFLGHIAGAPGELSNTTKVYGYFRKLAESSPRVHLEVIGKTEEGRDILLVAVADEEGIRDLAKLKAATAALADPRKTSPEAAERVIATARPIYYFNAGLHSTETGSPEMVMELAYRLAVSDTEMIKAIRKNVIVMFNPVCEPDGRDKVVDWFYKYLKGKTDYDNLPSDSPPYWGYYVFHDNNRDTHQKALAITRAVHKMFYDYHPTVVHDLHESIPLLHTWNGTGPYNDFIDPITTNEWLETSFHELQAMTALGMKGVWTWGFGENYGQHYLESVANNHNSLGRGYETFGNGTAETVTRTLRPSEESYVDKPVTTKEWYRPWPPDKTFKWSLRNNTNYMQTGCLTILDYVAKHDKELLRNFYRKGYNSWQKGLREKPYAFVIPEDQGDRRRVAQMVNLVRSHGIEVARATSDIAVKEGTFPKGSYVVRLDQPYRNYALDLLRAQKFPDTPYLPYDDVAWALPIHYGVEAKEIADEAIKTAPIEPVGADVRPTGRVDGDGPVFLLKDTGQEAMLAARFRLAKFDVEIAEKPFTNAGAQFPAGSWILAPRKGLREAVAQVSEELGLDFQSAPASPDVARHAAPIPRVAVWHTWWDTQSIGWLRMTLDQQKIQYSYIRDEEIRAGGLREKYDIILYGHTRGGLKDQINGIDPKFGPMSFKKSAEFPALGVPDASDDITGGIGWAGMANLQRFLDAGGIMITLANGSTITLDGGLVRGVSRVSAGGLATPGVELKVKFDRPDHPIAYGYPQITSVFRDSYPVYSVRDVDRRWIVLQWGSRLPVDERDENAPKEPDSGPFVVSGGAKGLDSLEGNPAVLDMPAGRGRVLAFNFNPMHRDLNRSDYRMLWNAILNWKGLPPAQP